MRVSLVNTGTELLLGRVLNTHQQWLGARMAAQGWPITHQSTVPDTGHDIERALRAELAQGGVILTTGGLGPTSDDLTRQHLAALLKLPLREDAEVARAIHARFDRHQRPMPPSALVQALVPEGAAVLHNAQGTAPGLAMALGARPAIATSWLIMLPGPPRELRPMFDEQVIPWLHGHLPRQSPPLSLTLRTTGMGESRVEAAIAEMLTPLLAAGLEVGYCAHSAGVDVRLCASGPEAAATVNSAGLLVRGALAAHIYGAEDETLEEVVVRRLAQSGQSLAVAESCTGGLLAHRITNVPGASAVLVAGVVAYSNQAKCSLLGVRAETLSAHGAVSQAVACEMATGVRERNGADFGLATTGIAGPGGGSADKPVGTVLIALASARGVKAERQFNPFDRPTFKEITTQQALNRLRVMLDAGSEAT